METPLLLRYGGTQIALRLLHKTDIEYNSVASTSHTPLILACYNKMTEVALALLDKLAVEYNCMYDDSDTPLLISCKNAGSGTLFAWKT